MRDVVEVRHRRSVQQVRGNAEASKLYYIVVLSFQPFFPACRPYPESWRAPERIFIATSPLE